ncbi:hypothetical protein QF040_001058 [Variovorax sp. W2I14]
MRICRSRGWHRCRFFSRLMTRWLPRVRLRRRGGPGSSNRLKQQRAPFGLPLIFLFRLPALLFAQQLPVALRVLPPQKLQFDPSCLLDPLRHAQQGLLQVPLDFLAGEFEGPPLCLQLRASRLRKDPGAQTRAERSQDDASQQKADLHLKPHQTRSPSESHFCNRSSGMALATSAKRWPTMRSACLSNTATGLLGSWFSNHWRALRIA